MMEYKRRKEKTHRHINGQAGPAGDPIFQNPKLKIHLESTQSTVALEKLLSKTLRVNQDCLQSPRSRSFLNRTCNLGDREQTEDNADSVRLKFDFLFASFAIQIIERQVGRFMPVHVTTLDPRYILDKLGGANPGEPNPQPAIVKRKYTA